MQGDIPLEEMTPAPGLVKPLKVLLSFLPAIDEEPRPKQDMPTQSDSSYAHALNWSRDRGEDFYSVWGRSQLPFDLSQSPCPHSHISAKHEALTATSNHAQIA